MFVICGPPPLTANVGRKTYGLSRRIFRTDEGRRGEAACRSGYDAVVKIITEEIEERWDHEWLVEMDKSWDAVHRCLGDGSLRTSQPSLTAKAVLGGKQLSCSTDWIVSYLTADEVKQVAIAIAAIDQSEFRRRYFGLKKQFLWIDRTEYDGPIGEEDFEYSWSNFEQMRLFFSKVAAGHRATVFSVDQ